MKLLEKFKNLLYKKPIKSENLCTDFYSLPVNGRDLLKCIKSFDVDYIEPRNKQNILLYLLSHYEYMAVVDMQTIEYLVHHSDVAITDQRGNNALNYLFKNMKILLSKNKYSTANKNCQLADNCIFINVIDYLLDKCQDAVDKAEYNALSLYIQNVPEELKLSDSQFDKLLSLSPIIKDFAGIDPLTYAVIMQVGLTDYQWNGFFEAAEKCNYIMFKEELSRYYLDNNNLQKLFVKIKDKDKFINVLSQSGTAYEPFLASEMVCSYRARQERDILSSKVQETSTRERILKI